HPDVHAGRRAGLEGVAGEVERELAGAPLEVERGEAGVAEAARLEVREAGRDGEAGQLGGVGGLEAEGGPGHPAVQGEAGERDAGEVEVGLGGAEAEVEVDRGALGEVEPPRVPARGADAAERDLLAAEREGDAGAAPG